MKVYSFLPKGNAIMVRTRPEWGSSYLFFVNDLELIVLRKGMQTLQWAYGLGWDAIENWLLLILQDYILEIEIFNVLVRTGLIGGPYYLCFMEDL
jgi:hypothetical protein